MIAQKTELNRCPLDTRIAGPSPLLNRWGYPVSNNYLLEGAMMTSRLFLWVTIAGLSGCAVYEDGGIGSAGDPYYAYPDYSYGAPVYGGAYPDRRPLNPYHHYPRHSHAPVRAVPPDPGIAVGAPDYRGVQSAPPRPAGVQRSR